MGKIRTMTEEEKKKYEELTAQAEQIKLDMDQLLHQSVVYGYARVSTKGQARDGNSLEAQEAALREKGATEIRKDAYTGSRIDRPELEKLLKELQSGDTLVVTKLDRLARSVQHGISLIDGLVERGVAVHVLNIGVLDDSPTGKLIRNIFLAFAEFEREMIMQRTREGKEVAKASNPDYREGRKRTYSDEQVALALELLKSHSYTEVAKMTGISKATLGRMKKR